jgi:mono/diheme cytochrome c family protein
MNDVIMESTQYLDNADLKAMAVYLRDLPADPAPDRAGASSGRAGSQAGNDATPPDIDKAAFDRGHGLYVDNCIGCHMVGGEGQPGAFPPLKDNPSVQAAKPDTVIHVVLAGGAMAAPRTRPTGLTMPAYAWKLSDADIADLVSYIRNAWGNRASAVGSGSVAAVRKDVRKSGAGQKDALNSPY